MNYISLCLEGSRTSEFEPSDRKDNMCDFIHNNCDGYAMYSTGLSIDACDEFVRQNPDAYTYTKK